MEKSFFICTKLIIKNKQNKILVLKRNKSSFDLPGGSLNYKEGPITCAKRELYEEIGIKIDNLKLKKIFIINLKDSKLPCLFIVYEGLYFKNDFKLNKEHEEYLWLRSSEINKIKGYKWIKETIR